MPLDSGVGDAHHVGSRLVQQILEEVIGAGRFPQKLVDLARRAVAEQHAPAFHFEPPHQRKRAQPRLVFLGRVAEGVVVTDPREIVVSRIGIPALAIRQAAG